MKLNWGTGITVALVLFMSFIVYLAYRASQSHSDLYAADYYKQELAYQDKIDGLQRGKNFYHEMGISVNDNVVEIAVPSELQINDLSVNFYRPNNADFDKEFSFKNPEDSVTIPRETLLRGKYTVMLQWKQDGALHLVEKQIEL